MLKIIKKSYIILIFLWGCANIQSPSGGPPDTTPPAVASYEPANYTMNYSDNSVEIVFDAWMDKSKVNENIFIYPTTKYIVNWGWKSMKIEFEETLKPNTTYAVVLGTEYADVYGNKPSESFTLIFATGDKLDSGVISGKVIDKNPSGAYVFAYYIEGINPDTLNPATTKPQYRVQLGTSGNFMFRALKDGKYRIFAIRDILKNELYDEGSDEFGAALSDINVVNAKSQPVQLLLGPAVNKSRPALIDVESVNEHLLIATFSKNIDTLSVSKNSFAVQDTLQTRQNPVIASYISTRAANKVEILTADALDTNTRWKLTALKDSAVVVKDSNGHPVNDSLNFRYFRIAKRTEYPKPSLSKPPFKDSTVGVPLYTSLDFIFSSAVNKKDFGKRIKFNNLTANSPMEYLIKWKADNIFTVVPASNLTGNSDYEILFKTDSLDNLNGGYLLDTNYRFRFQTFDIRKYGSLEGYFVDTLPCGNNLQLIARTKDDKKQYTTSIQDSGKWVLNDLAPEPVSFFIFCDEDGNGKYSYGSPFPYKFSEHFVILPKEIEVKSRWKIDKIILKAGK